MQAKFANEPYDLSVLQIKNAATVWTLRLPVKIEAQFDPKHKTCEGHAVYKFRHGNDYERTYYFERLEM